MAYNHDMTSSVESAANTQGWTPASRWIISQSWWIASELIRRNPDLRLIETHPGGGQYDCLSVLHGGRDPVTKIDLNRNGSLHVPASVGFAPLVWQETIAEENSHATVKALERAAGLNPMNPPPPSSPAALSYRVVARVLASLVNDRDSWDVRSEQLDSSSGSGSHGYLAGFPSASKSARVSRQDDLFDLPGYRFWALLRADLPVAILDTDGVVHLPTRSLSLPRLYLSSGRVLGRTIHKALGSILP